MSTSPIMTLFREFEAKCRQAGDMSVDDKVSDALLDECRSIEKRIMAIPVSSAQDLAAKLIAYTRYGEFMLDEAGEGGLLDEAIAMLAVQEHPDAELIELGRQFEIAKAKARPLEKERARLFAESERLARVAGLTDRAEDRQAHGVIRRRTGYHATSEAFLKAHSDAVRLMKAIHRTKATTLEGFAVKAAAVAFDQSDFEVDVPVPTDVAERAMYRLARDMAKAVKVGGRSNG
ncbi:MAG: hypothetical protein WA973_00465 [Mesorhizobium sp.]